MRGFRDLSVDFLWFDFVDPWVMGRIHASENVTTKSKSKKKGKRFNNRGHP